MDWNYELRHGITEQTCLPLYEGVDWNTVTEQKTGKKRRLPLYEGVDWNCQYVPSVTFPAVSLFTREWIEIVCWLLKTSFKRKSPSLRGSGLKFHRLRLPRCCGQSPSLRGSGLKSVCTNLHIKGHGLPLYEGVDWNLQKPWKNECVRTGLPLYEGVDWNRCGCLFKVVCKRLPLYEGVDWNRWCISSGNFFRVSLFTREWIEITANKKRTEQATVSLFTREWIEIGLWLFCLRVPPRLPLYEGVDWNVATQTRYAQTCYVSLFTREWIEIYVCYFTISRSPSPSLRGSGLKSKQHNWRTSLHCVSLFTREWIEIPPFCCSGVFLYVSLFTREWIEIGCRLLWHASQRVSLFTREWIEISTLPFRSTTQDRLPLYEGVDWNVQLNLILHNKQPSPSLRGSGLKYRQSQSLRLQRMVSLFTREWIEIILCCSTSPRRLSPSLRGSGLKFHKLYFLIGCSASPSLRGSGLKYFAADCLLLRAGRLPLYEGVDWNHEVQQILARNRKVSLFTGERIEMTTPQGYIIKINGLPLYGGADWNFSKYRFGAVSDPSPSLRGSGLKMGQRTAEEKQQAASLSHKIASVSNSKPSIFPKQK